jgi:hypothetical protein
MIGSASGGEQIDPFSHHSTDISDAIQICDQSVNDNNE